MSRKLAAAAVFALLTSPALAENSETPHLEFVKLYIEQLGAIEDIRDAAAKELNTDPVTQRVADCVHTMTQYQLELSTLRDLSQRRWILARRSCIVRRKLLGTLAETPISAHRSSLPLDNQPWSDHSSGESNVASTIC